MFDCLTTNQQILVNVFYRFAFENKVTIAIRYNTNKLKYKHTLKLFVFKKSIIPLRGEIRRPSAFYNLLKCYCLFIGFTCGVRNQVRPMTQRALPCDFWYHHSFSLIIIRLSEIKIWINNKVLFYKKMDQSIPCHREQTLILLDLRHVL